MFQSDVFSANHSNNRKLRKGDQKKESLILSNSTALPEGEEVAATSLGKSIIRNRNKKIRRVPSVEEAAATSLGNLSIIKNHIKINRKNAPNRLSLCSNNSNKGGSMERLSYATYSVGKGKEYSFTFKHEAVFAAQELGIKPTARRFKVSPNTVRSWVKKYQKKGKGGLIDQRKGPYYIPNKISADEEERIVSIRKRTPCFGPLRIKYFYNVNCSLRTIQRVINQNKLTRRRKKKTEKKRDLRAIKAKRPSITHIQMDLKHLYDIPNYWEQLKPLGLPKYQYTMRDTKSGMLFLGYSDEISELNARTMVNYVLGELKLDLPFDIKELTIQTDNGSEFSGQARRIEKAPFVYNIEKGHGAKHVYIRPGHCNANADVESSHELIEKEFYDLVKFKDRADFFRKIESYRLYFNFVRPNFSKGGKTPQQICLSDWNANISYNYSLIKTVDLDTINLPSPIGVQTIPTLADSLRIVLRLISSGVFN